MREFRFRSTHLRSLAAKDYEDLVTEYIAKLNISGGEA